MHAIYQLPEHQLGRYRQHLLNLDLESRRMRFGFTASDHAINQICDKIEQDAKAHNIFVIENSELAVVAAGHVAVFDGKMELAFSVLSDHRRCGMADSLMHRCLQWCQNRSLLQGQMVCLPTNTAMRSLAKKHGITVTSYDDESESVINLPSANLFTFLGEAYDTNAATLDHLGKLQSNFAQTAIKNLTFSIK